MIHERVTNFDPGWGELVDVDVLPSGEWAGVFRNSGQLFVRTADACAVAPANARFPLVRCLESGRYVLVDTRAENGRPNGWVLTLAPLTVREFFAGDGIQDVLASSEHIVVTYFDEGVFSGIRPGDEGVAIFSNSGEFRTGYQTALGRDAVEICDCYAACREGATGVVFLPYTDFPLVRLDVRTLEQTVEPTPQVLHGAAAISTAGGRCLFYSPYEVRGGILAWRPGEPPSVIGSYTGLLRGLPGGRFLSHGTRGFTIVECEASEQGAMSDVALPDH